MAAHMANNAWCSNENSFVHSTKGRARARNNRRKVVGCPANLSMPNQTMIGQKMRWADVSITDNETSHQGHCLDMVFATVANSTCNVPPLCSFAHTIGSPMTLLSQPEQCTDVVKALECIDQTERHLVLVWLMSAIRQLALSKTGCRIVQKALDVAAGADQDMLISGLQDHIVELYESPHGNYVLARAIEVLPAAKVGFVISALRGRSATVAKHKFGCRIVLRLIEHCEEPQIADILDEIMEEAPTLAHHAYGSLILQSMLEHMPSARRSSLFMRLLPSFATMSTHRTGSLVAQRVLTYCTIEEQAFAIQALLQGSVIDIACSHYGSYVIEQVAGMYATHSSVQVMANTFANSLQDFVGADHAERVLLAFDLQPRSMPCVVEAAETA